MDNKAKQGVEAGGFLFINGEDAVLADKERKQIEYLEKKLDYKNPEQILAVLQKLIEERTFKTPVGMLYLKKLQDYLLNKKVIAKERIPFIPVDEPCDRSMHISRPELKNIREARERQKERKNSNYMISVMLNVLLTIAVVIMFWAATRTSTPNILNYKTALENKYASWEEELEIREQAVREKELLLKIEKD